MRLVVIMMCATMVITGVANAEVVRKVNQPYRGECRKLTNQIDNLDWAINEARRRDNPMWERASMGQQLRMASRRERLCPGWGDQAAFEKAREEFMRLLKLASELALRYFTFGLY